MPVFLRVVGRLKMDYHGVRLINGMEGWVLRAFACANHSMNLHDARDERLPFNRVLWDIFQTTAPRRQALGFGRIGLWLKGTAGPKIRETLGKMLQG